MFTTYKTVTLEKAKQAINAYNDGSYGCLKNPEVDRQAREMFENGLGDTEQMILRQVDFIGRNYGGAAGFKAAYALSPEIAHDIFIGRAEYERVAISAVPVHSHIADLAAIQTLYRPFVKPLHGKQNWQVWATKFWHFLNPEAFPIEDRFVNHFFELNEANSAALYLKFLSRFRDFAISHNSWLPELHHVDGGLSWCDNKIWDKMCYGLGVLGELHC
jgi:hypothetical protein